ncbi:hypothetical protein S245_001908, partial [Arachis hypogaea]
KKFGVNEFVNSKDHNKSIQEGKYPMQKIQRKLISLYASINYLIWTWMRSVLLVRQRLAG